MEFKSRVDQISHTLPTTRHRCNLDCVGLGEAAVMDTAHSIPGRVLNEYNEDLIFLKQLHLIPLVVAQNRSPWIDDLVRLFKYRFKSSDNTY